ncbi:GIY-YIG nuclease family protein [Halorhabdus sp. CBA1104]|uniref:GIY-YIG nuclease family protein n=1 Tax=unclassified Halorhabdus TaxID=2621901 RepID=UPI0012B3D6B5|nr:MULTISPECIES: GIY-YIG nuclease family protein [unclassified Halorhabdus]QGN05985.1 GIY-YIG nuclease family protein [Halorhabdus sp. CBA1104]
MSTDAHFVYVLRCEDDTLYTGYTTDPERRLAEHQAGEGAKYTRGRTPVELVHLERFESRSAAQSREYEIKQHSRDRKASLIEGAKLARRKLPDDD